jgi:hypothetical protein
MIFSSVNLDCFMLATLRNQRTLIHHFGKTGMERVNEPLWVAYLS